jgi:hypothetical protein
MMINKCKSNGYFILELRIEFFVVLMAIIDADYK